MSTIVIALTSGDSWTVPVGCTKATLWCIGAGLNGHAGSNSGGNGGNGGNGGCAASALVDLVPGTLVSYQIGAANGATGPGSASANTWFGSASTVLAAGGATSTQNCVGTTVYAGGAGGAGNASVTTNGFYYYGGSGGGGGGAAGPNGAGNNGGAAYVYSNVAYGAGGGSGDNGSGGAGGSGSAGHESNGSGGKEWTATGGGSFGAGGGGSGATGGQWNTSVGAEQVAGNGYSAGSYGAGGGGGGAMQYGSAGTGGASSHGLIVIIYDPEVSLSESTGAFVLAGSDTDVTAGRRLSEATGNFELTGSDLVAERGLDAETGAFSLHGSDANLDAPVRHIDGDSGSFDLTGHVADAQAEHEEPETKGSFALTGSAAQPTVHRELPEEPGSFSVTGKAAKLAGVTPPTTPVALLLAAAVAGNAPVMGRYTVPDAHIFDLGYVGILNLSENWVASGDAVTDDFFAPSDFFGQNDVFNSAAAAQIVSWVEVNIGVPDGNGGIAWNGWQKFSAGSYPGQYAKRSVVVVSPSPQIVGTLLKYADQCSVQARIDHYQDLSIPTDGLTITFTPDGLTTAAPFNAGPNGATLPFVSVTYNNQSGDTLLISALSKSSVTIQILNAGVGVARSGVNVAAEGY